MHLDSLPVSDIHYVFIFWLPPAGGTNLEQIHNQHNHLILFVDPQVEPTY